MPVTFRREGNRLNLERRDGGSLSSRYSATFKSDAHFTAGAKALRIGKDVILNMVDLFEKSAAPECSYEIEEPVVPSVLLRGRLQKAEEGRSFTGATPPRGRSWRSRLS